MWFFFIYITKQRTRMFLFYLFTNVATDINLKKQEEKALRSMSFLSKFLNYRSRWSRIMIN
jgi:hypothetical protein